MYPRGTEREENKMFAEIKCPNCGTEVVEYDTLDLDMEEGRIITSCVGNCPSCKKLVIWEEYYIRQGYKIL